MHRRFMYIQSIIYSRRKLLTGFQKITTGNGQKVGNKYPFLGKVAGGRMKQNASALPVFTPNHSKSVPAREHVHSRQVQQSTSIDFCQLPGMSEGQSLRGQEGLHRTRRLSDKHVGVPPFCYFVLFLSSPHFCTVLTLFCPNCAHFCPFCPS